MLADAGFDIAHAFDLAALAGDPAFAALANTTARRAVLVGNTRALWPVFVAARAADPALDADPDPLERYTEATIARAFPGAPAWFAHRRYDGAFLPFQRIATATGLAALAPTHLVIHPIYGPWFALRAVILVDGDPPPRRVLPAYHCSGTCTAALGVALAGSDWRAWLAVRDACTVGRHFRYSDDQIAYHYEKAFAHGPHPVESAPPASR